MDVTYESAQGKGILLATVVGSGMAALDGTVVNVALKHIGHDLGASLAMLQWVVNGYMLSLSALILVGGSLGDLFGRRRIFRLGVLLFSIASVACGLSTSMDLLVAARVVQGVGGALLTPSSLAIMQSSFRPADRSRAIGAWSSLGAIANLLGPLVGGALVQFATWHWAFWLNLPLAAVAWWAAGRHVPETTSPQGARLDVPGALLATAGLAALTMALIMPHARWALGAWGVAALAAIAFLMVEHRRRSPMVPLGLFRNITFSGANLMTLLVYAGLGAMSFFLALQLQVSLGFGPLAAGLATLPTSLCMMFLAGRFGALAAVHGPRWFMAAGPLLAASGVLWLSRAHAGDGYWADILPGVLLFGIGLSVFVAPLTSSVLAAAPDRHAGIASGINTAVARAGSLLAVAALPSLVGLQGRAYADPSLMTQGFRRGLWCAAAMMVVGGVVALVTVPSRQE